MFLALECGFITLLVMGIMTLTVGARRYNISHRTMTITFALTALSWMGFLLTTIALVVYTAQLAVFM